MANQGKKPIPKTQREIFNDTQVGNFNPPAGAMGFANTGNPNNAAQPNRS